MRTVRALGGCAPKWHLRVRIAARRADVVIGPYDRKRLAVLPSGKRKRQELSFLPYEDS